MAGWARSVCCQPRVKMPNKGFSDAQKLYLEGLVSGLRAQMKAGVAPAVAMRAGGGRSAHAVGLLEQSRRAARERLAQTNQRPCAEDRAKEQLEPDEMWGRMVRLAKAGEFPSGDDVFRYKFHGLFYTAPAENAFMCRLRFAGGVVNGYQLAAIADLVERYAAPQLQLTTRSNLQLRGIGAAHAIDVLTGLHDLGVLNRGAGADGVRNVVASPTAGFDRQELIDTRPLARETHHYLLASRHVHALPRKFGVTFDGGGAVGASPETSDLGWRAVQVGEGAGVEPGVYFRLLLGGSPSHGRFGRDAGVVVRPEQCLSVFEAVLALYMEHGDRTNRRRARLVYLLESWGLPRFVQELEQRLEQPLPRVPLEHCVIPAPKPFAHLGFHNQRPRGNSYAGISVPAGVLSSEQARGLARIADEYGGGELRLTPWHTIIVPHLKDTQIHRVKEALAALGLPWAPNRVQSGLVACTGRAGCKFALADTKRDGIDLIRELEARTSLDVPIQLRISGCHHACAQQITADIGLLATGSADPEAEGTTYDVSLGGRDGPSPVAARPFAQRLSAKDVVQLVADLLEVYTERRLPDESFHDFVARVPAAELRRWARRKSRAEGSTAQP